MSSPLPCYLKSYRKRTGLSQRELGLLLGFSTAANVSRYEIGQRLPYLEAALCLEIIFEARMADLFPPVVAELETTLAGRAEVLLENFDACPHQKYEHLARIAARSRP